MTPTELLAYTPPADLLAGRVILVTGASAGLGRAVALACAARGATVVLHGRHVKRLEKLYDEIEKAGHPQPAIVPLDLSSAGEVEFAQLADTLERELGRLDGLVLNAAATPKLAPLSNQSLAAWTEAVKVNLLSPVGLIQACLPLMAASPDASVVLSGETHGARPGAYWGPHAVSKAGLLALATVCAQEWEATPNLRANTVIPGPMRSPQRARTHPAEDKTRLPMPADLAPAWLWLLGPESRGVTGKVFDLAGQ